MNALDRRWLGCIVLSLSLRGLAGCGGDAPSRATLVEPTFDAPCRYAQCSDHGWCASDENGAPLCLCNVGYTGASCTTCEAGFHTDALGRCAPDRSCDAQDPDPCGLHGGCDDSDGVIMCDCDMGFEGPRCTLCQPGFARDKYGECLTLILGPDGGPVRSTPGVDQDDPSDSPNDPSTAPALCTDLSCNTHGACDGTTGSIACACSTGYSGQRCENCAVAHHRDASETCVADESCTAQSCTEHGDCEVGDGVVACTCTSGYAGSRCQDCAPGFHAAQDGACAADQDCLSTTCAGHGACASTAGVPSCACEDRYGGAHCEACVTGYHHGLDGTCVVDEVCAANTCKPHGTCDAGSGVIVCACATGYRGQACAVCAAGFHDDGSGTCVGDERCQAGSCGRQSVCDESTGSVECRCKAGYTGDACSACADGYHRNPASDTCDAFGCADNPITKPGVLTFDKVAGMPRLANNCISGVDVSTDDVQMASLNGDGTVWACAASDQYGVPTKHVVLAADSRGPGQLLFAGAIATLSFDYAAKTALALELVADGTSLRSLIATEKSTASLTFTFDAPITALSFRAIDGAANQIALDNIAYAPPSCQ